MTFSDNYQVKSGESLESMLTNAGLDWRIQRTIPAIRPIGYVPGESDPTEFQTIDSHRFLRRSDNGAVFAAVSKKYRPHQNADIIGSLVDSAKKCGTEVTTIGSLKGGAWVFGQVDLGKQFTLKGGDRVNGKLTVTSRHDGTGTTRGGGTAVAIICANTFMMAARDLRGVVSHKQALNADGAGDNALLAALKTAATDFDIYQNDATTLSGVGVGSNAALLDWIQAVTDPGGYELRQAEAAEIANGGAAEPSDEPVGIEAVLMATELRKAAGKPLSAEMLNRAGKGVLEAITEGVGQDLPSRRGTWWGAANAVTYYSTHMAQARNPGNRTASAMVGPNAEMGRRALNLALDFAQAQEQAS